MWIHIDDQILHKLADKLNLESDLTHTERLSVIVTLGTSMLADMEALL